MSSYDVKSAPPPAGSSEVSAAKGSGFFHAASLKIAAAFGKRAVAVPATKPPKISVASDEPKFAESKGVPIDVIASEIEDMPDVSKGITLQVLLPPDRDAATAALNARCAEVGVSPAITTLLRTRGSSCLVDMGSGGLGASYEGLAYGQVFDALDEWAFAHFGQHITDLAPASDFPKGFAALVNACKSESRDVRTSLLYLGTLTRACRLADDYLATFKGRLAVKAGKFSGLEKACADSAYFRDPDKVTALREALASPRIRAAFLVYAAAFADD